MSPEAFLGVGSERIDAAIVRVGYLTRAANVLMDAYEFETEPNAIS